MKILSTWGLTNNEIYVIMYVVQGKNDNTKEF